MSTPSASSPRRRSGRATSSNSRNCGKRSSRPRFDCAMIGWGAPPRAAPARLRARDIVALLPKIVLTALLALAIADMIVGVFLRYVVVTITDWLDLDTVNFFW